MKILSSVLFSLALLIGIGFTTQVHAQAVGCSTTGGYNGNTGASCNGSTVIPQGCSSVAGFSSSNSMPCNGSTAAANNFNGTMVNSNNYLNGCSSTGGYSITTGYQCNTAMNGIIYAGPIVGTVNIGLPGVTTITPTSPGLPTTGGSNSVMLNILLLASAALVATIAFRSVRAYSTS